MIDTVFLCLETTDAMTRRIVDVAHSFGDRVVLVSSSNRGPTGTDWLELDLRDEPERVAARIREQITGARIIGALTDQEAFVVNTTAVAQALGVARHSVETATNARDKSRMKHAWQAAGVRTPAGTTFRSRREIAGADITFPAVIKPTHGYSSSGVRRVDDTAALLAQAQRIGLLNATTVARDATEGTGFLVEQCLRGPEFAVDTVWFDGEPIHDCVQSRNHDECSDSPYFPDRVYLLDPAMPAERRKEILDITYAAVRALGITHGATHSEVRYDSGLPYMLETAARPGGSWLVYELMRLAHDADFTRALYLSHVCADAEEFKQRLGPVAWRSVPEGVSHFIYYLPHSGAGLVKEIHGLDELAGREEVLLCHCYKQPGSHLLADDDLNAEPFCNVIARQTPDGPSLQELLSAYDRALTVVC
ncbi:acetyl-CoA carboxylase biotin carboxylase subunit family protein [Kitasatospora sp. NPDC058048]|uniref:ATP-grasp domain-containing protein n=1 Tax=Kitasatospora sp. NPDC058048 TaxID=3346313 RepID=UPI0036DA935E